MRLKLDGRSGGTIDGGDTPALDSWITGADTFTGAWGQARLTMQYPLNRKLLTLDDVPATAAAIAQARSRLRVGRGGQPHDGAAGRHPRRPEAGAPRLPLLMAQLGLLAAVVLSLGGRRGRRAAPPRGGARSVARPKP